MSYTLYLSSFIHLLFYLLYTVCIYLSFCLINERCIMDVNSLDYLEMIDNHAHWNQEIGEWQLRYTHHTPHTHTHIHSFSLSELGRRGRFLFGCLKLYLPSCRSLSCSSSYSFFKFLICSLELFVLVFLIFIKLRCFRCVAYTGNNMRKSTQNNQDRYTISSER